MRFGIITPSPYLSTKFVLEDRMITLNNEQLQELGSLIDSLVAFADMETRAELQGNDALADNFYKRMQHIAARIRALGIPFHDIPDPGEE